MNSVSSAGLVTLSRSRTSFIYDINEKSIFSSTGFKMLRSREGSCFVKCAKSSAGGRIRLTYDVTGLLTMQEIMPRIYSIQYIAIVYNLLSDIIALRNVETIYHENISLDANDIFIDPKTFKAYFIYLPLERKASPGAHITFEKSIRKLLADFAYNNNNGLSSFVMGLCEDLVNFRVNSQLIIGKLESEAASEPEEFAVSPLVQKSVSAPIVQERHEMKKRTENNSVSQTTQKTVIKEKRNSKTEQKHEVNDLLINMSKKSYDSTNPDKQKAVLRAVKKEKKKIKKETANMLVFFACYFPILFVAVFVILNYYKNSGMNGRFVLFIVATFMFVFMAPVIFFTRRTDKNKKKDDELYEQYIPPTRGGFLKPIVIKSVSNAMTMEFFINKEEFVIGKLSGVADGVIPFDQTVSDEHCMVVWNDAFYLKDLNSDYGTFVNEVKIVPGQDFPLKNGDKIRISKNVFEVKEF